MSRSKTKAKPEALDAEVISPSEASSKAGASKSDAEPFIEGELEEEGEAEEVIDTAVETKKSEDPESRAAREAAFADVAPADDEELDRISRAQSLGASSGGKTASSTSRSANTKALATRDPLGAYMAEVRRHPLLTREEEYELAVRWVEEGDKEAARKLVTSNLRLVVKIANEYRRGYQNLLDLVQEGNVGLLKAVQKFDPYRGVKLSTYAGWWIRAYVLKYILDTWRMVKIGTTQNQRKLFFNLRKQRAALQAAGIEPTAEAIANALDVSTEEVVEMQKRLAAPDQSLDAPLHESDDGGGRTRVDMVQDEGTSPEADVGSSQLRSLLSEKLRQFGQGLEGREAEIFRDRVVSDEPVTLQSLGDRWGVSRERARQLEKRMLLRLRAFLQDELGDTVSIALGHDSE